MSGLTRSAGQVQAFLETHGLPLRVVELPASTRTAKEAAAAIGCEVAQIAKSIVFRAVESRTPVLVVASGRHRIDEERVGKAIGESVERASPDFVRASTGFAIGGVPPCGHAKPIPTLIDKELLNLETVWAAAGTPHAVFSLEPRALVALTNGRVLEVAERNGGTAVSTSSSG